MHDVLNNVSDLSIKCLDKGFIRLLDVMPRLVPEERKTSDYAIVEAARVSFGNSNSNSIKSLKEDNGLIHYLMRHNHLSCYEMVRFKFRVKLPIFVARQWYRHRMANYNEMSGRYTVFNDEFYIPNPDEVLGQSDINKQGGINTLGTGIKEQASSDIEFHCKETYNEYSDLLNLGVSKEQARTILPLSLYTQFIWCIDLRNLLHFLDLRLDSHAQSEIRIYAQAILDLITPIVPVCVEAWNEYSEYRGGLKLTRSEVEAIKSGTMKINNDNKRLQEEWKVKANRLGYII